MSAKLTPGPWVTERSGSVIWIGTPRSNGQKVDEIVTHIEINPTYKTEAIEKKLANAKLIAAAPDMLHALQSLVGIEAWIPDQELRKVFSKLVYPAIDKATK